MLYNSDYLLQGVLYMLGGNSVVCVCYRRLSYYLAVARGVLCGNEHHIAVLKLLTVGIVALDLIISVFLGPYYAYDLYSGLVGSRLEFIVIVLFVLNF